MLSVKYFFGKNISPKPFLDCENGRKNSKNNGPSLLLGDIIADINRKLKYIQLFREKGCRKSPRDNPERYCGWFEWGGLKMFLADYEATSTTLRWILTFLVQYPKYQEDTQR